MTTFWRLDGTMAQFFVNFHYIGEMYLRVSIRSSRLAFKNSALQYLIKRINSKTIAIILVVALQASRSFIFPSERRDCLFPAKFLSRQHNFGNQESSTAEGASSAIYEIKTAHIKKLAKVPYAN